MNPFEEGLQFLGLLEVVLSILFFPFWLVLEQFKAETVHLTAPVDV